MSVEGNKAARVALGTFLAGAAMVCSGGEAALADGSTAKFSLPPISQAKDRWVNASCFDRERTYLHTSFFLLHRDTRNTKLVHSSRLTPVNRCAFKSSAMGQANAARDKLYDLRECDMRYGMV